MKRPKTVWLLLAYFAIGAVGAGLTLAGYESNNEYQMFRAAGLEPVFFALFGALFLLCVATVRALWTPSAAAIRVGTATITAFVVYEIVASTIALQNPAALRAALAAEMAARGHRELADAAFAVATSPATVVVSVVVTLAAAAIGVWLFRWNRPYFDRACVGSSTPNNSAF